MIRRPPRSTRTDTLFPYPTLFRSEIGFITAQIKDVAQARVGDTVTDAKKPAATPLPGFKEVQPVVFCGMFPTDANDFEKLLESIQKLRMNDASFSFEMESSAALGFGLCCGFLGLIHRAIGRASCRDRVCQYG